VRNVALIAIIRNARRHVRCQTESVIELANQGQSGIAGDRSAFKVDTKFWLESKSELFDNLFGHRHSPSQLHSRLENANVTWTSEQTMAFLRPNL
jgi:hypothetical protein